MIYTIFCNGRQVEKPMAIMKKRLQIFLLLFFGEYQTCFRVLIDKIAYIYIHGNLTG